VYVYSSVAIVKSCKADTYQTTSYLLRNQSPRIPRDTSKQISNKASSRHQLLHSSLFVPLCPTPHLLGTILGPSNAFYTPWTTKPTFALVDKHRLSTVLGAQGLSTGIHKSFIRLQNDTTNTLSTHADATHQTQRGVDTLASLLSSQLMSWPVYRYP
jgi:hypothetical protein